MPISAQKHADRKDSETPAMLICLVFFFKKSYETFVLKWFQPVISGQI